MNTTLENLPTFSCEYCHSTSEPILTESSYVCPDCGTVLNPYYYSAPVLSKSELDEGTESYFLQLYLHCNPNSHDYQRGIHTTNWFKHDFKSKEQARIYYRQRSSAIHTYSVFPKRTYINIQYESVFNSILDHHSAQFWMDLRKLGFQFLQLPNHKHLLLQPMWIACYCYTLQQHHLYKGFQYTLKCLPVYPKKHIKYILKYLRELQLWQKQPISKTNEYRQMIAITINRLQFSGVFQDFLTRMFLWLYPSQSPCNPNCFLAGLIYYFQQAFECPKLQSQISEALGITGVSLRTYYRKLKELNKKDKYHERFDYWIDYYQKRM